MSVQRRPGVIEEANICSLCRDIHVSFKQHAVAGPTMLPTTPGWMELTATSTPENSIGRFLSHSPANQSPSSSEAPVLALASLHSPGLSIYLRKFEEVMWARCQHGAHHS
ncbi:unnamed protein product [Chrysoparadoxa australica]